VQVKYNDGDEEDITEAEYDECFLLLVWVKATN